jgi:hypothetical protein
MGHITRLRRLRRLVTRLISKNAQTLMTLRGITADNIPGTGKITLPVVEEYLRTLEASAFVNSKTDSNYESESENDGEAKVQARSQEEE